MSREIIYSPAWWIPGGHLQTLWGKLFRRQTPAPTALDRWETPDGDFIDIDFAGDAAAPSLRDQIAQWAKAGATGFHVGLEGTSLAHYLERLEWFRTEVVEGL